MKSLYFFAFLCAAVSALWTQFRFQSFDEGWTAAEKHTDMMRTLLRGHDWAPAPWFPGWKLLVLFLESMNVSFDHSSDWIPQGRDKLIHS
jgi:hypothetical protein